MSGFKYTQGVPESFGVTTYVSSNERLYRSSPTENATDLSVIVGDEKRTISCVPGERQSRTVPRATPFGNSVKEMALFSSSFF